MKILFLRIWVGCLRLCGGAQHRRDRSVQEERQLEALLRQANPFASWNERANWMIDIADWLRHVPRKGLPRAAVAGEIRRQRLLLLLDWLDAHRDVRRLVQTALQKTLREAAGPELFSSTGLPREPAFFSELVERIARQLLPRPMEQHDLAALFAAIFRDPADADWLLALDAETFGRVARLCTDEGIAHSYMRQVDDALSCLAAMITATGATPAFRQRLDKNLPLQATPFVALRRELEKFCLVQHHDAAALRSVKMLVAVCRAQTDRIYAHLDEHGVSTSLVYAVERMRAQLVRVGRLIDLRAGGWSDLQGPAPVQALLADLIRARHARESVPALVQRSFSLRARKLVERNARHGRHDIARDDAAWRALVRAGGIGGAVAAITVLGVFVLHDVGGSGFFAGLAAALNYAGGFLLLAAAGGALAARQSAVTAPALAARMAEMDGREGLPALLQEAVWLLRAQAATVCGNLAAIVPVMALLAAGTLLIVDQPLLAPADAHASLASLSVLGLTPLHAAMTGVLLWLSGLAAGFADNWFALRKLRPALAHNRRLAHALGAARAERLAGWVERHVADLAGILSLACLFGMGPAVMQFFGLGLEVRHVTLSAGVLSAAAASQGWQVLGTADFWLAAGGVIVTGVLNVGVAFGCALALAMRARALPPAARGHILGALVRRLLLRPRQSRTPYAEGAAANDGAPAEVAADEPRIGTGG